LAVAGGEKSLTAVALLFAPTSETLAFLHIDEIGCGARRRNIGISSGCVAGFSAGLTILIKTHKKRTVIGSTRCWACRLQESGVSKAIAWRVGVTPTGDIFCQQVDMS
jgi:chromosome segregation ATPase